MTRTIRIAQVRTAPSATFTKAPAYGFYTSVGTHRYWRVYVTACIGSSYVSVAEFRFSSSIGGSNLLTGGTPSSSASSGGATANAIDGNNSTFWGTYSGTVPQWWSYDFGVGVAHEITEVAITSRNDSTWWNEFPKNFQVQYSDDGAAWSAAWTVTDATVTGPAQTLVKNTSILGNYKISVFSASPGRTLAAVYATSVQDGESGGGSGATFNRIKLGM